MKFFIRYLFLFIFSNGVFSQNSNLINSETNSFGHPVLSFNYSFNNPTADWSVRFGTFNTIGGEIGYKTKNNWMFLTDGHFIFGNQFKETNLLDNLKTVMAT